MKRSTGQLLLILLFCVLGVAIVVGAQFLMFWTTSQIVMEVCTYSLVILVSLLFIRLLRLPVSRGGFLVGSAAGIASMVLIFAFFLATGLASVVSLRDNFALILLAGAVTQLFVACGEELSFRAVIFQGLDINLGFGPAIIISSVLFTLMHVPSMLTTGVGAVTLVIGMCTLLIMGVVLALLYKYGGLLNAVAFHFFWNFLEYKVLGLGSIGALKVNVSGADILTGGSFGPEASVVTLLIVTVLAVALWYRSSKKVSAVTETAKS